MVTECPPTATYLWRHFVDLHRERGVGMAGPLRLTARNIIDWAWCAGVELELWERRALRALDDLWLEAQK